jgi:hypothetical protein
MFTLHLAIYLFLKGSSKRLSIEWQESRADKFMNFELRVSFEFLIANWKYW